jgi:hypothetical protein
MLRESKTKESHINVPILSICSKSVKSSERTWYISLSIRHEENSKVIAFLLIEESLNPLETYRICFSSASLDLSYSMIELSLILVLNIINCSMVKCHHTQIVECISFRVDLANLDRSLLHSFYWVSRHRTTSINTQ